MLKLELIMLMISKVLLMLNGKLFMINYKKLKIQELILYYLNYQSVILLHNGSLIEESSVQVVYQMMI
jgi:hypothetical protein